jgi:hypothetical protein
VSLKHPSLQSLMLVFYHLLVGSLLQQTSVPCDAIPAAVVPVRARASSRVATALMVCLLSQLLRHSNVVDPGLLCHHRGRAKLQR